MDDLLPLHRFALRHQRQHRMRAIQEAYRARRGHHNRDIMKREARYERLNVEGDTIT